MEILPTKRKSNSTSPTEMPDTKTRKLNTITISELERYQHVSHTLKGRIVYVSEVLHWNKGIKKGMMLLLLP